eukprot:Pgem_evm1s5056
MASLRDHYLVVNDIDDIDSSARTGTGCNPSTACSMSPLYLLPPNNQYTHVNPKTQDMTLYTPYNIENKCINRLFEYENSISNTTNTDNDNKKNKNVIVVNNTKDSSKDKNVVTANTNSEQTAEITKSIMKTKNGKRVNVLGFDCFDDM